MYLSFLSIFWFLLTHLAIKHKTLTSSRCPSAPKTVNHVNSHVARSLGYLVAKCVQVYGLTYHSRRGPKDHWRMPEYSSSSFTGLMFSWMHNNSVKSVPAHYSEGPLFGLVLGLELGLGFSVKG